MFKIIQKIKKKRHDAWILFRVYIKYAAKSPHKGGDGNTPPQ